MTRTLASRLAVLPPAWGWAGTALLGLWGIYSLVFYTAGPYTLPRSSLSAAVNVLPLVGLALVVQRILAHAGRDRGLLTLIALHAGLAAGFSLAWYGCVIAGLGMLRWFETGDFLIQPFSGPALPWQAFQGLALYTAVAALCLAFRKPPTSAPVHLSAERYLMRVDDALIPVQVAEIVCLQGAHDYVQLTTSRGTHLVRHGLSEFGARLNPGRFVRIHRSVLVNLDHVERVEMLGGGKFKVLLSNGSSHTSSRAGAQILRAMVL